MIPDDLTRERKRRGEIFKNARELRKITLKELSRRTGVARHTIRKIEDGRSSWSVDTEIILMKGIGINQVDGNIEICQEGGRITSLKITGVNLNTPLIS